MQLRIVADAIGSEATCFVAPKEPPGLPGRICTVLQVEDGVGRKEILVPVWILDSEILTFAECLDSLLGVGQVDKLDVPINIHLRDHDVELAQMKV